MLSHMHNTDTIPSQVEFLYSTCPPLTDKHNVKPSSILFLPRLTSIAEQHLSQVELTLFLTNKKYKKIKDPQALGWFHDRRMAEADWRHALGSDVGVREGTVVYVCGPPGMTDEVVEWFGRQEGMDRGRVFCEKWW